MSPRKQHMLRLQENNHIVKQLENEKEELRRELEKVKASNSIVSEIRQLIEQIDAVKDINVAISVPLKHLLAVLHNHFSHDRLNEDYDFESI